MKNNAKYCFELLCSPKTVTDISSLRTSIIDFAILQKEAFAKVVCEGIAEDWLGSGEALLLIKPVYRAAAWGSVEYVIKLQSTSFETMDILRKPLLDFVKTACALDKVQVWQDDISESIVAQVKRELHRLEQHERFFQIKIFINTVVMEWWKDGDVKKYLHERHLHNVDYVMDTVVSEEFAQGVTWKQQVRKQAVAEGIPAVVVQEVLSFNTFEDFKANSLVLKGNHEVYVTEVLGVNTLENTYELLNGIIAQEIVHDADLIKALAVAKELTELL